MYYIVRKYFEIIDGVLEIEYSRDLDELSLKDNFLWLKTIYYNSIA